MTGIFLQVVIPGGANDLIQGFCLQVVVMAGGANDFALDATDLETWQTPYLEFIDQVSCCSKPVST